ncbi:hypothetical protein AB0395_41520 [Streptosporangium sp. NPDC051023]|uniref:hypothetical protein n=1 Tax=Streptosporangium sp. NPDC051023 TaxID=3155410 RepID=UPI00344B38E0
MTRRIAGLAMAFVVALGMVVVPAGSASATISPVSDACTATGIEDVLTIDPSGPRPRIVGTSRHDYVGAWPMGRSTFRFWHVSYQPLGSSTWSYLGGYAVRCSGATETGSSDLTTTIITGASDRKCDGVSFDVTVSDGTKTTTTHYGYVGSRTGGGDHFHYYRVAVDTGQMLAVFPAAARCD